MIPLLVVILGAAVGVGLLVVGLRRSGAAEAGDGAARSAGAAPAPRQAARRPGPAPGSASSPEATPRLPGLLGVFEPREENMLQSLRLTGVSVAGFALQRLFGTLGGVAVGVILSLLLGRGAVGTAVLCVLACAGGWFLPMLSVRDNARKRRAEVDQVVRMWVVLVAQHVTAGIEPAQAMLNASQAGTRPGWKLLHRFLLSAQQERRGTWEGLRDLVNRYGIRSLEIIVSSLSLAAGRGTRLSDAVLGAAESLWKEHMGREKEAASRRSQVVVVPATGVALALAGILVYPPFTSLSGGGIAGLG